MKSYTRWLGSMALAVTTFASAHAANSCPSFRWVTLGTAGGPIPTPQRSEPANLLIAGDQKILVDTGDGTANQLAKLGLDVGEVGSVFISHHHMDHTGGLAAVIGIRWQNDFPGTLTIYGPPGTKDLVDGLFVSMGPQVRIGTVGGKLLPLPSEKVQVVEIRDGDTVSLDNLKVKVVANTHFAHRSASPANPPQSLSYRFNFEGRSITYTGDTGPSAAVTRLATGTQLLVSEVVEPEKLIAQIQTRRPDRPQQMWEGVRLHFTAEHLTPEEVGIMAQQAGVEHLVLTHLAIPSGPIEKGAAGLRAGVRLHYTGPVDVASDMDGFDVGCGVRP